MKPIKVKELIAGLMAMNPDALVGISKDSEGNEFSLMADKNCITKKVYMKNELGSQDTYFTKEDLATDKDIIAIKYCEPVAKKKLAECIVLWPTN